MAVLKELGRFLEKSAPLIEEARESLKESRAALAALRPAIDTLPGLLQETQLLVVEVRRTVQALSPLLIAWARENLAVEREPRA